MSGKYAELFYFLRLQGYRVAGILLIKQKHERIFRQARYCTMTNDNGPGAAGYTHNNLFNFYQKEAALSAFFL